MRRFCVSRKGGTGGGGWGHPQGGMHMVAARLGCQSAMDVLILLEMLIEADRHLMHAFDCWKCCVGMANSLGMGLVFRKVCVRLVDICYMDF